MKRRITLSIALALSFVLVSLMSSDSTVMGQQQLRFTADTGVITLGPNQVLRVAVAWRDTNHNGNVVFRRIGYTPEICNNGVCKQTIESQTASAPITLMPGEAASFDIPASFQGGVFVGIRGVVLSNNQNVKVQGIVFDTSTQRVALTVQMSMQRENQ